MDANTHQAYPICLVFKQVIFHEIPVFLHSFPLKYITYCRGDFALLFNMYPFQVGPVTAAWRPRALDGGDDLQVRKVDASILTKRLQTADKGWSFGLVVGRGPKRCSP